MTGTAPASALETHEDGGVRRPPRWAMLVLAAVLCATWSLWALHAFRADLRTVSVEEFRDDLATGSVHTYVGLTEFHPDRAWPADDRIRISTAEIPDVDAPAASTDPRIVAVAYYVDAWRAPMRVVLVGPLDAGPGALPAHELVRELEAAGIPPKAEFVPAPEWQANPAAEWAQVWGVATMVLALVSLLAIRPTRGTRWFWFWLFSAPLGLGILAYLVAECLRPRRAAPAVDGQAPPGRFRGVWGLAVQVGAKFLIPY